MFDKLDLINSPQQTHEVVPDTIPRVVDVQGVSSRIWDGFEASEPNMFF